MKLIVDTVFERVSIERFIAVYFSEDFNNRVAPIAGLKSRALVEEAVMDDGSRDRRVRMHPNVSLPGFIRNLASEEHVHYDEISHYDAVKKEVRYDIDSKANDRVKVGGVIRFLAEGSGVRRVIDGVIEIKAPFGIGSLIEKFIEVETQKGYAKIGIFLQAYLDGQR